MAATSSNSEVTPLRSGAPGLTNVLPDTNIDPDLPTVVLTHGLQSESNLEPVLVDTLNNLWIGNELHQAGQLIANVTDGKVNIIQYVWQDAFQVGGGLEFIPDEEEYLLANSFVPDAGANLARQLLDLLGEDYREEIHFIGHSLGTAVIAYAVRLFLERSEVTLAQFTALDRPDRIDELPLFCDGI